MNKLFIALRSHLDWNAHRRRKYRRDMLSETRRIELLNHHQHSMQFFYHKNQQSELALLCDKYGSAKGTVDATAVQHRPNYADFYELIFWQNRESIKSVLECGIGYDDPTAEKSHGSNGYPGASLRVWLDYFPNAEIVGLDIAENVLFSEERITTYQVDQTSPNSIASFKAKCNRTFDIIIDDGLHTFIAGKILFENIIDRLANDGYYIIEDVHGKSVRLFAEYFASLNEKYQVCFFNANLAVFIVITKK